MFHCSGGFVREPRSPPTGGAEGSGWTVLCCASGWQVLLGQSQEPGRRQSQSELESSTEVFTGVELS